MHSISNSTGENIFSENSKLVSNLIVMTSSSKFYFLDLMVLFNIDV